MIVDIDRQAREQIDERRRAEARARSCRPSIARGFMDGTSHHEVKIGTGRIGYVRKEGTGEWSSIVYDTTGEPQWLSRHPTRAFAAREIAERYFRDYERQVLAELALAKLVAADIWPRRRIIPHTLGMIAARLRAGQLDPEAAHQLGQNLLALHVGQDR